MIDKILNLWQYPMVQSSLKIILIILGGFIAYKILRHFLDRIGRKIVSKTKTELDDQVLEFIMTFLRRISTIIVIYFIANEISQYSGDQSLILFRKILYVIVVLVVTTLAVKLINIIISFYLRRQSRRADRELNKNFGLLMHRAVQIVLYVTALIAILTYFNVDVRGLVATLGVGSLAIALAAQETLANLIAGFVIMVDRPFRIGDRIKTPSNVTGEVFEIGLRSMKLLDFEKNLHVIPNSEIVKSEIINYSYPNPAVRIRIDVGVAYGSDLRKIKQIITNTIEKNEVVLSDPEPNAFFIEFGDSSLNFMVVAYVQHYKESWRIAEELRLQIYEAFKEHSIEIPFPQRVVHIEKESE